jgi:hypothetical protein
MGASTFGHAAVKMRGEGRAPRPLPRGRAAREPGRGAGAEVRDGAGRTVRARRRTSGPRRVARGAAARDHRGARAIARPQGSGRHDARVTRCGRTAAAGTLPVVAGISSALRAAPRAPDCRAVRGRQPGRRRPMRVLARRVAAAPCGGRAARRAFAPRSPGSMGPARAIRPADGRTNVAIAPAARNCECAASASACARHAHGATRYAAAPPPRRAPVRAPHMSPVRRRPATGGRAPLS